MNEQTPIEQLDPIMGGSTSLEEKYERALLLIERAADTIVNEWGCTR